MLDNEKNELINEKKELDNIKEDLDKIIKDLGTLKEKVRYNFKGVGNDRCALVIEQEIAKFKKLKNAIEEIKIAPKKVTTIKL